MRRKLTLVFLLAALSLRAQPTQRLDVEAHAGGKGSYPGNSIPAFLNALQLGATTLEMDCVVSRDSLVVVSHDPFMHHGSVLTPSGGEIEKEKEAGYRLFNMPYDSIRQYQLGRKFDPEFPAQKRIKTYLPLLSEVVDSVEAFIRQHRTEPVNYNVEIKSYRPADFNPSPPVFADLVVAVLNQPRLARRVTIQSFDVRPLQHVRQRYPQFRISYLISKNNPNTLPQNLAKLGFVPEVLSPEHELVTPELVEEARRLGMAIIPWTVDNETDLRRLIDLRVDGIITNYPDRLLQLMSTKSPRASSVTSPKK
ncbi:MAG: glycerophosphodiester phosphodiesterase [Ferruginibacter sp.]|nr:glycerophosphodiester phosphodiesterase [Cytophagales bacterium]